MATPKRDRNVPPGVLDPARRTIHNNLTGEVITIEKYGCETNGEYATATLVCKPGGGPPLHYHTSYAERFEPIEGTLGVMMDGKEHRFKPGDKADVPIGMHHRFFNDGDKDIILRGSVIPAHAGFEKSLVILFGLCNDGLSDPKTALPKSLLQTAIVADLGDMRFPGVGGIIMNTMIRALAAFARWRGVEEELLKKYWD